MHFSKKRPTSYSHVPHKFRFGGSPVWRCTPTKRQRALPCNEGEMLFLDAFDFDRRVRTLPGRSGMRLIRDPTTFRGVTRVVGLGKRFRLGTSLKKRRRR